MDLILAPRSGSEARAMLMDKTAEARESASKLILDAEKKAREIIAKARETAGNLLEKRGGENPSETCQRVIFLT